MLAVREEAPRNAPEIASQVESQQETSYLQQSHRKTVFSCLYTKQKTQKHKKWQDGRLVVSGSARLYHADPPPGSGDPILDQCELSTCERDAIFAGHHCNMETEKFLITIEGPWAGHSLNTAPKRPPLVSNSMRKVLTKKFRKPTQKAPPPPQQNNINPNLAKRRRPLQPGELIQKYYGNGPPSNQGGGYPASQQQQRAPFPRNNGPPQQQSSFPPQHQWHDGPMSQEFGSQNQVQNNISAQFYPPRNQTEPQSGAANPYRRQISGMERRTDLHGQSEGRGEIGHGFEQLASQDPIRPYAPPTTIDRTNKRRFSEQPPSQVQIDQRPATKPSLFASNNGFDASAFYGDDEEDEAEEEEEVDGTITNQCTERGESFGWTQPAQTTDLSTGGSLSNSQILELFSGSGADPLDKTSTTATEKLFQTSQVNAGADSFILPDHDSSDDDSD